MAILSRWVQSLGGRTMQEQRKRVMPQSARVDIVRAARVLGSEGNRGLFELARTIHGPALLQKLQQVLSLIDQDEAFSRARQRVVALPWDGVQPINGIEAEKVRASHQMGPNDGAYLVWIDDQLIYFQVTPGVTNHDEILQIAEKHVDEIAAQLAVEEINHKIAELLLTA